jgi:hypothetical protein
MVRSDVTAVRHLANRVRRAGIASAAADELNNVAAPTAAEVAELLETMVAALEASPVPKFEWTGLARVFPPEDLASLLHILASSLKRYQQGERATPDSTAARLHFLALVVGDLAGSYNDVGIRRWFPPQADHARQPDASRDPRHRLGIPTTTGRCAYGRLPAV